MSKMISLDGLTDGLTKSFKESVDPMDVIIGAGVQRVIGPTIHSKLEEFLYSKIDALTAYPTAKKFLSAFVTASALYLAQKGSKRARGHVVGVLGIEAVDYLGGKVREMLPDSLKGLVEFNSYGILTQDAAYGVLTADSAYGEPSAYDMAKFQAETEHMTEVEPEAEYA
jgi:hypothetical protein